MTFNYDPEKANEIFVKVLKYGAAFFIGYYLGGGCESKIKSHPYPSEERRVERRAEDPDSRINELERKIESLERSYKK